MSTPATSTGAEASILESGPVELNDSLPSVAIHAPDDQIAEKSYETGDRRLCYGAACEIQLVSAAKSGDQRAFAELCRRYIPSLKRRILQIIRNREDSEDILQDTLLNAYKHLADFRSRSTFRTWITTIAINNSLMLVRKRRNRPEIGFTYVTTDGAEVEMLEASDPLPNPEEVFSKRQVSHRVAEAVRRLPPGFRQVVEWYHHDEVRLVDAAKAIGITPGAAKSRLMRARSALRSQLNNDRNRCID